VGRAGKRPRDDVWPSMPLEREGETFAKTLVPMEGSGRLGPTRARIRRLNRTFRSLYRVLRRATFGTTLAPSIEEWLLDNDYLVGESLERLDTGLDRALLGRLPWVALDGVSGGAIRVQHLARSWVTRGEGRIDPADLSTWIRGIQRVHPLTLAELWALPAFLTLEVLDWLADGLPPRPAGNGAPASGSVGGAILSLRALASEDWRGFVEEISAVDQVLRQDPAGAYPEMDFRTRDRYRHAVEAAAHRTGVPEWEVAARALDLARADPPDLPTGHVGFFLVGEGSATLYHALGTQSRIWADPIRRRRWAGVGYTALLIGLAVLAMAGMLWDATPALRLLLFLPALVVAIGFAVGMGNWLVSHGIRARPLPRLDFRRSIPNSCRTVVAVPVLLSSREDFDAVLHRLEINYHGNPDPSLSFVVLADLRDAPERDMPGESALLQQARKSVETLNRTLGEGDRPGPFFLLHRARRWSEAEGVWMGWERKRGKLAELNALLLGAPSELHALVGDVDHLRGAPFVITLDADTILPRGAAARMVGTLAHPLNLPQLSAQGRLKGGYSVLQPRIELIPQIDGGTAFSRIFGGVQGIDLYAHAAFDVYQDLFDEAIFAGKGIYHVEAFERVLQGRVPDNAILSHDLFEGVHGRAGLISDLVLLEDFPTHPAVHARRAHRWVRGDWQLLPWLAPRVPSARGQRLVNPLSLRARWMILDNLRRSLHAPAALLLILLYLGLAPGMWRGLTVVLITIGLPVFCAVMAAVLRSLSKLPTPGDLRAEGRAIIRAVARFLLELSFLPFEARMHLDAIARTLYRVLWSRRRLLEWTTAAATARRFSGRDGVAPFLREFWMGPVLALVLVASMAPALTPVATGFFLLWVLSPVFAWIASIPRAPRQPLAGVFPRDEARALARRSWGYFERFQEPSGHWLPPDNYQEDPNDEIADRTSPTNMAMALTSAVVAWDLGFLGMPHFVARIRNTMGGMERLVRYRGHFLNWYQIRTLEPLAPLYVSTVDSGNLAAALVVVRQALEDAAQSIHSPARRAAGLLDTVRVVHQVGREMAPAAPEDLLQRLGLLEHWTTREVARVEDDPHRFRDLLLSLQQHRLPELQSRLALFMEERKGLTHASEKGLVAWVGHLRQDVNQALDELDFYREGMEGAAVRELQEEARDLANQLADWLADMDFQFLYDEKRHLFHIGFSVSEGQLDRNHYDLLASEARIASIVAIGKGDVPIRHWLQLGRPFAGRRGGPVLLSWAGTLFEYLMPSLFMHAPPETLLHDACRRAVEVQQAHGRRMHVPWGVSESAYHVLGAEGHYQYRAFGVPGLGLRRERGARQVVAPYASIMAIGWAPASVHDNLKAIRALGGIGPWGPYEALDFGAGGRGSTPHVVYAYMSHHHGMLLAALGNHLSDQSLVRRFHQDRAMASMEPYLLERIPWRRSMEKRWVGEGYLPPSGRDPEGFTSWSPSVSASPPPVHLLSNGSLSMQLGPRGRGGSTWEGWRLRRGGIGKGVPEGSPVVTFLDLDSGKGWDPLPDPSGTGDPGRVIFAPHRAEFTRITDGIRTRMTVVIPPRDDLEIRDLRLVNEGQRQRRLRILMWMDAALAPDGDEERHPAFHKLFVRAEALPDETGLLLERRPRTPEECPPVLGVTLMTPVMFQSSVRWMVDREALLGRHGNSDLPRALWDPPTTAFPEDLPCHPLDPVAAVSVDVTLAPFEEVELSLLVLVGKTRGDIVDTLPTVVSASRRRWLSVQARSRAEGEILSLGGTPAELPLWERLLSHILHPHPPDRAHLNPLDPSSLSMADLWPWGISGDLPILLLLVRQDAGAPDLVDSVIRALAWWHGRGVHMDLVILDEAAGGYEDPVGNQVRRRVAELGRFQLGEKGGIHLLDWGALSDADHLFFRRMASLVLDTRDGGLDAQVARWRAEEQARTEAVLAWMEPAVEAGDAGPVIDLFPLDGDGGLASSEPAAAVAPEPLRVPSPWGGFSPDGETYEIRLAPGERTPAPWANVVAGDGVGFVVTEAGGGFTWGEDAGEFRLTPWSNDPLLDPAGEVILLTDLDRDRSWTPWPGPRGLSRDHVIRHSWGGSELLATTDGLEEHLSQCLHPEHPAKEIRLSLRNVGEVPRLLRITLEVAWVLGPSPSRTARDLLLAWDPARLAVVARNPHRPPFERHIGFLMSPSTPHRISIRHPDNRSLWTVTIRIHPGAGLDLVWFLGTVPEPAALDPLLDHLRRDHSGGGSPHIAKARDLWREKLKGIQIQTPEPALDLLMNGWLAYQTLSSRMLGRTGFYQSGGAFGFRDQLQDAYTLLPLDDRWARAQLLKAARHQFEEGDVLHWWHPGTRRGVRTRCSDDLLWLPFVLAGTVRWTGDPALTELRAPFLSAPPLPEGVHERYDLFPESDEVASLWEHGRRAIELAWDRRSPRGLPLIGTGDWNDGMDRVGVEGRGESIWLGWFLARVLKDWAELADSLGRSREAAQSRERAEALGHILEAEGWDGAWYRRAFFDDGTPIGSKESIEVRIDSIAQSWAVLSGAADPQRAERALTSAWEHLVRLEDGLALLLYPPFDGHGPHPGYIAAYPPGVRENGGQYTHAAAWLIGALARAGRGDQAGVLLKAILPTHHGGQDGQRYRVEPYVVAADVYGVPPHVGRGGWTWYTGSAGWIFRVVLEEIFGVRKAGSTISLNPCIPSDWKNLHIKWWMGGCEIQIQLRNPHGVMRGIRHCWCNGEERSPLGIPIPKAGTLQIDLEMG